MLKVLYSHSFQSTTRIIKALIILVVQARKQKHKVAHSLPCGKFTERSKKWTTRTVERKIPLAKFTSK